MRIDRYLELKQFIGEVAKMRILHHRPTPDTMEYLERERILIPRLRLRYPDEIERRWFDDERYGWEPVGTREPDGERWDAACALEEARQNANLRRQRADPLDHPHPLDHPNREWRQFIQYPKRRKFVTWDHFKVRVGEQNGDVRFKADTVVTYYSSWQLLLILECQRMGVHFTGNTDGWNWIEAEVPEHWRASTSFEPIRALRKFAEFERQLDAVVWFTQEKHLNEYFVLRNASGRRIIEDDERDEMERRTVALGRLCRERYQVSYPQIIELLKYLSQRWDHWHRIGCDNHAKAYKRFIADATWLARYLKDVPVDRLFDDVGRVTGHFKPTLRVIFQDWATEWREDAQRILEGFATPGAILTADFTKDEVRQFLDFVEHLDMLEFYWRWRSLNERAFSSDANLMAGLRSDLQGMALSVEHIVDALLEPVTEHPKRQLYEKFKQLWPASTAVGRLLKSNDYRERAFAEGAIDLAWHDELQEGTNHEVIASDLALCHAIRGSAHYRIVEDNQLLIERMSVILLRGVMQAFRRSQELTREIAD